MRTVLLALLIATASAAAPPPEDTALYREWCARCHGERGDGRGPAAAALRWNGQPPRDFTAGRFKVRSTPSGQAPTDDDLARTIRRGLPGTSMPYFGDLLDDAAIRRLVGVVRGFATTPRPAGIPVDLGVEPPDDAASRARGAERYRDLGCAACHGDRGRGDGPAAAQLRAADGTPLPAADLGRPWTFRGGATAPDVALRLATGLAGTPMPGYLDVASAADLWDVAHWVGSIAVAPSLRAAAVAMARAEPGAGEQPVARGAYVMKSSTCFLCHVQMNPDGSYAEGSFGAGGMRVTITHTATLYSRNLTPDDESGLGRWSAGDLRRALRDGRTPAGRVLNPLDMPWTLTAGLTDGDVDAMHAYLRTLPPVSNLVPPPEAPSLTDGIAGKLGLIVRGAPVDGGFWPGNAGRPLADREAAPPTDDPTTEAWLALACLALSVVHVVLRGRRHRLEAFAVGGMLFAVAFVYAWPPLRWMPAALVRADPPWRGVAGVLGLPPLRPPPAPRAGEDTDATVLARRGRYVATIGTCPLCHTAGPNSNRLWQPFDDMAGGLRVRWRVFGTTWSRNLTPDPETGLGAWSTEEIVRAITSGLARDGRTMHWQAMPWDHFANFRPEDLEALVAYLRQLPPVRHAVPVPVPPRDGDPEADTFTFGPS